MVSSSHVVSATLSSSGGGLLTLFPCCSVGSSMDWRWISALSLTFVGYRETTYLTKIFTRGCRGISAPVPGTPPPPASPTLVSTELFLSHILTLSWLLLHSRVFFFPVLKSWRRYHHHWLAQPWRAAGPSWSWLALTLSDTGEASSSFSQKPPL